MKKSLKKALLVLSLAIPTLVLAQDKGDETTQTTERRRFWGSGGKVCTTGSCQNGQAWENCVQTNYAFWIAYETNQLSMGWVPCN